MKASLRKRLLKLEGAVPPPIEANAHRWPATEEQAEDLRRWMRWWHFSMFNIHLVTKRYWWTENFPGDPYPTSWTKDDLQEEADDAAGVPLAERFKRDHAKREAQWKLEDEAKRGRLQRQARTRNGHT